jgi:uncharacterized protein YuzE
MLKLVDTFPSLAKELSQWLHEADRDSLAQQIDQAVIARVTFDNEANAGYIYIEPSQLLTVVESEMAEVHQGESIPVGTQFWTNIDTDNFGQIVGIEILEPRDLKQELKKLAAS